MTRETREIWLTPAGPVARYPAKPHRLRRLAGRAAAAIALRIAGTVDGWDNPKDDR